MLVNFTHPSTLTVNTDVTLMSFKHISKIILIYSYIHCIVRILSFEVHIYMLKQVRQLTSQAGF